jgi:PAS domain S-box-containing protein
MIDIFYVANEIKEWGAVAGGATAISIFLYGLYKYMIRPLVINKISHAYNTIVATSAQVKANYEKMEEVMPIIDNIAEEFRPNHGSSMRDCINRIEDKLEFLKKADHVVLNLISDVGYFETDENGDCVWANDKYLSLVGRTLDDIKNRGWINHIHFEDRKLAVEEWYSAVKENRPYSHRYRYVRPDDSILYVKVHANIIYSKKGECIGAIATITPCPEDCPCLGNCPLKS